MIPHAALPDAVVFDNDGLLLDTESVWTRAEQDLRAPRHGLQSADKLRAGRHLRRGRRPDSRAAAGRAGRAAALIEELNELVVAELEHGVEAMVGARMLLSSLQERGHADRPSLQLAAALRRVARWRSSVSRVSSMPS